MVVGERKPFEEIMKMLEGHKKIMVLGCGGCVTVCLTGGQDEVRVLSSQLRMARDGRQHLGNYRKDRGTAMRPGVH